MAYAFVQQNANDNAAGATTITVTLTPTAGNLLVFAISADSADTTSIALSDNLASHNTFTQIGTDLVTTNSQRCAWWFAANCKGGATTFTATFSASARFRTIYVAEYSGIATTSPFLNGARAENDNPGTGTDVVSSGVANATSQPALVWGFSIDTSGTTTPNAGTGFTSRTGVWSTATCLGRPEDKRVTATGNVAATFTATTGTDTHATGVGIFAESVANVGSAAGTSTVSGAGAAIASAAGTAAGSSTVAGVSPSSSGAGSAAGTSTVAGGGAALVSATGSAAGSSTVAGVSNNIFPLAISSDGRYLKQSDGTPFLLCADTSWSLFVDIPLTGGNDLALYFSTLVSQGFNAVSGNAIEHHYTVVKPPKERGGLLPFTQTMSGASYTGSPNGTTGAAGTQGQFASDNYSNINTQAPDCTFINNSYWLALETILNAALSNNLVVLVWPGYLGFHADDEGWMNEMVVWDGVTGAGGFTGQSWADNTKSKMWNYGAWLGNRWKAYPNIIWVLGGDYGSNTQTLSTAQASAVSNLMAGLKSITGAQSQLYTAHWDRPALSTDTTLAAGAFDLNGCYADDSVAELARRGYAHAPTKPTIGLEYFYENDLFGGSAPYRKYVYWQFLGGVAGGFYGNEQIWRFDDGTPGTDWTTLLSTQARNDAIRQFAFWKTLPWHRLKPSGLGGMGALVTAGGGTASPQSTDYVAAACTSEGDLLLAYVPPAHTGSVTIDMTKLAATAVARWFDPTNGTFTAIGPIANTGTHAFTVPGTNSAGDADFLLVLQTSAGTAAGTSSVVGTGAALAAGAGTAAGTGIAAGTGASIAAGTGAAAGSATVSGSAAIVLSGVGSAAGAGVVSGVGAALAAGAGTAAGSAGVSGVGASLDAGAGAASGTAAVAGTGAAIAAVAGSTAGTSAVSGVGAALAAGTGSAAGVGTASGVGAGLTAGSGTGTAAGIAVVSGAGAALAAGAGSAAGSAAVSGVSPANAGAGLAVGVATVSGAGASWVGAAGTLTGMAAVTAISGTGIAPRHVHITGVAPDPEVYDYTGAIPPTEIL